MLGQVSKEDIKTKSILFLCLRRVLLYVAAKLEVPLWRSWIEFHQRFPKGDELRYLAPALLGSGVREEGPCKHQKPWQRAATEGVFQLFDGVADECLLAMLQKNPFAPAEVILANSGVKKVCDFEKLIADKENAEMKQKLLVEAEAEEIKKEAEAKLKALEQKPEVLQDTSTNEAAAIPDTETQFADSTMQMPEEPPYFETHFPDLELPPSAKQTFKNHSREVLSNVHRYAMGRASAAFFPI